MKRLKKIVSSLAVLPLMILVAPTAQAVESSSGVLVNYDFSQDDGRGKVENSTPDSSFGAAQIKSDAATNAVGEFKDGALLMDGDYYVDLPDGILTGKNSATVSVVVQNDAFNSTSNKWSYLWTLGSTGQTRKGSWVASTHTSLYSSVTSLANGDGETYFAANEDLSTEKFQTFTATLDGATKKATLYINGRVVGSSPVGVTPDLFGDQTHNTIGESRYPGVGDAYFHGKIKSFTVYGEALSKNQIVSTLDSEGVTDLLESEASKLNIPTEVASDFELPTAIDDATIEWSSSDEKVIDVSQEGIATVTPLDDADTQVTLTAALTPREGLAVPTKDIEKTFDVTVLQNISNDKAVKLDAKALTIQNADDMRSNFSVPSTGANGSTISWAVKEPGAAKPEIVDGVNKTSKSVSLSRPAAGSKATQFILTATLTKGDATVTKDLVVTVKPMPTQTGDDEAYVWAFFTGEGVGGEKISLAASKGNNALDWNTLNEGTPLFESQLGEKGLRDPFILRSKDGDKFYMLATDLKIAGRPGSFSGAQMNGSTYIEIWESTDLVNWSAQRHVKVSTDHAGNTWAPEAYWDDEIGKYVVYWASNLYEDTEPMSRKELTYNRMMYTLTDDFVTFSNPQVWIDVDRRGQAGAGSIDVTVAKENGVYYRVFKDENSMTLRQEVSKDLLATVSKQYPTSAPLGEQWSLVGEKLAHGSANGYGGKFTAGEGPSLFKANKGDVNGYQYYLFADQPDYHGGPNHYVPLATHDISDVSAWEVVGDEMPEENFPTNSDGGKPRHGTVVPVTRAQYQKVLEAFAPNIAVVSVEAMGVEVVEGQDPTGLLPETVILTKKDGSVEEASVKWEAIEPAQYANADTFSVRGTAQNDSMEPVEAIITVVAQTGSKPDPTNPEPAPSTPSTPGSSSGNEVTPEAEQQTNLAQTGSDIAALTIAVIVLLTSGIVLVMRRKATQLR